MNEAAPPVLTRVLDPLPGWPGTPGVHALAEPPEGVAALLLAGWAQAAGTRAVLHVARSATRAARLAVAARGFAPALEVIELPPWDCLPYDRASPLRALMGRRVAALRRLLDGPVAGGRLVLTTADALLQRVPPRTAWADAELRLEPGAPLDLEELRLWLLRTGYVLDERVDEPGEVAIRGEVVDLFPADAEMPARVEMEGGRVAQIRRYDPLTQRTVASTGALLLQPASELILGAAQVRGFAGEDEPGNGSALLTGSTEAPRRIGGLEHRLPSFHDRLETVFDYLPDAVVTLDAGIEERRDAWLEQITDAYESRRTMAAAERRGPIDPRPLEPQALYLSATDWQSGLTGRAIAAFTDDEDATAVRATPVPRFVELPDPAGALADHIAERQVAGDRVVLAGADPGQCRRLSRNLERRLGRDVAQLRSWAEVLAPGAPTVAALELELAAGFALPGLAVIAFRDVFPEAARPRAALAGPGAPGTHGLRPGDVVVHADHGVGSLRGLEVLEQGEAPCECLVIEYAAGRKLLVPAVEIDRIWRYGSEDADVALDRLNGDGWRKRRAEVEAELEAAAAGLIELARKRAAVQAPRLTAPKAALRRFAARFPFTETEDQARAIEAVLADLARGSPPTDRLVCGDVGYGKTEVALRAACAAALAGKQVALIAPTTVLVRQHLKTFRRRFAGLDVRIEQLSRLTSGAGAVRQGLADGSVRIVIGTHALASDKVRFADLGLVIVDEEQRFGTRQKQRLRALREGVHVLTLSATPIPRTLQAAMVGLVDVSVIATPPVRRRPVRTFVLPFDPVVVREALRREHQRGGQSFVVCPRIQDLEPMAQRLAQLVPEVDLVVAHGRMKGAELDELMVGFADGRHDVLLSTDIVEAGLDIPNANTMLVWRADRFGLAQLHQLRGRVGRGRRQAFTYLLADPEAELAPATEQRLRTLEALEGLGAGFAIGARDLDLRGAGDLLGAEQAGHLKLIGTELYQHLLQQALRRARGEALPDERPVELNLGAPALIPADYVPEPEVRLDLYRRLAGLDGTAAVEEFADELADRFGPPPEPVALLLAIAGLRQRCRQADLAAVEAGPKAIAIEFRAPETARDRLADGDGLRWRDRRLIVEQPASSPGERLEILGRVLDRLEGAAA